MKKHFEWSLDENKKEELKNYYEDTSLPQHSVGQNKKSELKVNRIKNLINFKANDIVLDVGCSKGYLLKKLSNDIKKGIGLDISESVISSAQYENKKSQNLEFKHFDGKNVKQHMENKVDKVTIVDVLEHAFEPDSLLSSIYKVVKEDGHLIIEVPFTGWLSELVTNKYHQGHLRYYDPDYLRKWLISMDWSIEQIETYNSVPFASVFLKKKSIWKALDRLFNLVPAKFYPYFGEIIVTATKGTN